jgi:hypothetical protein
MGIGRALLALAAENGEQESKYEHRGAYIGPFAVANHEASRRDAPEADN